jgi:phytoene desaturase
MPKVAIIGSGFAGLSAACYLSAAGHDVHVFEKNEQAGGRARQLTTDNGYVFDMGPSWYWMPGVFECFFQDFGESVSSNYELCLLDPSFDVIFEKGKVVSIPAAYNELRGLFESIEKGSAAKLDKFMQEAKYKYEAGMDNLVYKPGLSFTEFADSKVLKGLMRLQVFSSYSKHVRKYFSHPHLVALMEFPVLFLGAMPQDTPALYSLMNYAGLKLGTWYPKGGFGKVVEAMVNVARKNKASFHFNSTVEEIRVEQNMATSLVVNGKTIAFDVIVAAADYHHAEQLLPSNYRNYNEAYWAKKTFAPSCLIYYLGITKRLGALQHHSLFFDEELLQHSIEIYKQPQWPTKPLFYVCCPSRTDDTIAPKDHENLFLLMPLAPGLEDNELIREKYFQLMMNRLQQHIGEDIINHIDFKKSYCVNDFVADYNSYKGNAYGLANTLRQTALLRPSVRNKKLKNFFYAGQLTVPGPGVPPALISGKIAATQALNHFKSRKYEAAL